MLKNEIIAIVPARGGSKRVPKKNIRNFMGLPLIFWSINAAKKNKLVNRIIVSSDDEDVINISLKNNIEIHKRPKKFSTDQSSTENLLHHLHFETNLLKNAKYIILLQPTSPLRLKNSIDNAIKKLDQNNSLDGLIEVTGKSFYSGKVVNKIWKPDYLDSTRSQDISLTYFPTGGMYIYHCKNWFKKKTKKKMLVEEIHISRVVNIDNEEDFDWAKFVYQKYKSEYVYLTS
jgi:CMP-N,N'-diacetyllegionaminic acid synthase